MTYAEAREYLYSDGSLRDVYAQGTNHTQLNAFMDYVRPLLRDDSYTLDGIPATLPDSYLNTMLSTQEVSCVLRIPVGPSTLNCYFFDSSDLELDFVPRDYDREEDWNQLTVFLQGLANAMRTELYIAPENSPETKYVTFSPNS